MSAVRETYSFMPKKGFKHSKKSKLEMSKSHKGLNPWNKGTKGVCKLNSGSFKKGHRLSEETKKKISKNNARYWLGKTGKKSISWKGGLSKKPYPFDFNRELKELIEKRDNYTCQLCKENPVHSAIHHIDYNKKNLNPDNLILLCRRCNSKVNFNRKYWIKYFKRNV